MGTQQSTSSYAPILTPRTAGTNPIHNKKPKKKAAEEEGEEDKAYKLKQAAGITFHLSDLFFAITDRSVFQTKRLVRRWPRRLAARGP